MLCNGNVDCKCSKCLGGVANKVVRTLADPKDTTLKDFVNDLSPEQQYRLRRLVTEPNSELTKKLSKQ